MIGNYELLKSNLKSYASKTPLTVGTQVWVIDSLGFVRETSISEILIDSKGVRFRLAMNSTYFTAVSSLGKTVFLCRGDATEVRDAKW